MVQTGSGGGARPRSGDHHVIIIRLTLCVDMLVPGATRSRKRRGRGSNTSQSTKRHCDVKRHRSSQRGDVRRGGGGGRGRSVRGRGGSAGRGGGKVARGKSAGKKLVGLSSRGGKRGRTGTK